MVARTPFWDRNRFVLGSNFGLGGAQDPYPALDWVATPCPAWQRHQHTHTNIHCASTSHVPAAAAPRGGRTSKKIRESTSSGKQTREHLRILGSVHVLQCKTPGLCLPAPPSLSLRLAAAPGAFDSGRSFAATRLPVQAQADGDGRQDKRATANLQLMA